jgi:Nose resistant-to-fluoxetine protein, N-terminal domain
MIFACLVLDATGKPSSGLLRGATWWMGDYDECLSIKGGVNGSQQSAPFKTAYCSLSFGNASHQATPVCN